MDLFLSRRDQTQIIRKRNSMFSTFPRIYKPDRSTLKIQSFKLCNNKYMIISTQITNAEVSAFISLLVFKLLSRKILFTN